MVGTTAQLSAASVITAASITAQFAPIPGLVVAGALLSTIYQLWEQSQCNKHAAKDLATRCYVLLNHLATSMEGKYLSNEYQDAILEVENTLRSIQIRMERWASLSRTQAFVKQHEVQLGIQSCHESLNTCMMKLNLTSILNSHNWQEMTRIQARLDHEDLMGYLSDIGNSSQLSQAASQENNAMLQQMMAMMQQMMGQNAAERSRTHHGLSTNLWHLQKKIGHLADFHLKNGEVQKKGEYPITGGAAMDVYEGMFLDEEKVAIKVVRSIDNSQKSLRRFEREVKIWSQIWNADKGNHILPFYGYCLTEGPYPWMISPWQKNGNAMDYVRKNEDVDHLLLTARIAKGLSILHGMKIVHGDLKSANVLINDRGRPLIADFGLSQIVEDVTGVPFTQSRGVSESYRWFAPEVCMGKGTLSFKSDIYSFAMTILEIMSHEQPYSNIKHPPEVVIRTARGELPLRPSSARALDRGLDDKLWSVLLRCWDQDINKRPTINELQASFPFDDSEL
ncbi:kinase-like domain-containing protein [Flagelloscypha sp. PMI_526]|nr:kinase-like domain-containing protein [Flagelloscypha sp. PMI_526]